MRHLSVIARKDGWALPANFGASLERQQVIIFVCVTHATMDLPVTCYAQIIVHSVLMGNVIVDLRVGGETTARGKDVLDIRKIAQDMDNVCLQKRVSVIQAGVVSLCFSLGLFL